MSVITVMLYGLISSGTFTAFDLKIGGLNETELYDLRKIPTPFGPLSADVERFGAWSASFRVSNFITNQLSRFSEPPVEATAPYLSRIKSWGYKITFYNSYVSEINTTLGNNRVTFAPILTHSWILEKDSEIRFLPPVPTNPPMSSTIFTDWIGKEVEDVDGFKNL